MFNSPPFISLWFCVNVTYDLTWMYRNVHQAICMTPISVVFVILILMEMSIIIYWYIHSLIRAEKCTWNLIILIDKVSLGSNNYLAQIMQVLSLSLLPLLGLCIYLSHIYPWRGLLILAHSSPPPTHHKVAYWFHSGLLPTPPHRCTHISLSYLYSCHEYMDWIHTHNYLKINNKVKMVE